jgi:hypothetical protein
MAQRKIEPRTSDEMRRVYPIEGRLAGWFFRAVETSNGAWLVEGCDIWGRKVSRSGTDPDVMLEACVSDATAILAQLAASNSS